MIAQFLRFLLYLVALVLSHPASWLNRIYYSGQHPAKFAREHMQTRHCVLCGSPMVRDFRPERDGRRRDGTSIRIPEDILAWWHCPSEGGCGQSYQGEMKT